MSDHLLGDSFVPGWPAELPVPYNGPFRARVMEIHDGDTLTLSVAFKRNEATETIVRLYGVNAPELSTPEGVAARDFLRALLPIGSPVWFTPLLSTVGEYVYTFGRCVGAIEYPVEGVSLPFSLANTMFVNGHAVWCDRNLKPLPGPPPPIPRWRPA